MKKIFIYILVSLVCLQIYAQQVSEQEALEKARAFMPGKQFESVNSARSLKNAKSKRIAAEHLYIFNVENKDGFVIVSGDERTEPILAYSDKGHVDANNLPDNLRSWLEGYELQIEAIAANPQLASVKRTNSNKTAIAPLIKAQWDQGLPYCLLCPDDEDEKCITGCVATALAQVMYHHRWPTSVDAISGYTTIRKEIVVDELPATTFEWDKMKDTYTYDDSSDAAYEVAKLMRYCGQALKMDYTSEGSATSIEDYILIHYFGYSPNTRSTPRSMYTTPQWENLLYNELINSRPVLYEGNPGDDMEDFTGHQFILDGYDDGLFHVNWGWGGACDGYFLLSLLNPYSSGGDNGVGACGYVSHQVAIIGMEPATEESVELPKLQVTEVGSTGVTLYRESKDRDYGLVALSGAFSYLFSTQPAEPVNIDVGWGLFQKDGQFVSCLSYKPKVLDKVSGVLNSNMEVWIDKTLPEGDFDVYQVYRWSEDDEWQLFPGSPSTVLITNVENCLNVFTESDMNGSFLVEEMNVLGFPELDVPVNIRVKMMNPLRSKTQMLYVWEGYDGDWKQIGLYQTYLSANETGNVYFWYTPKKLGEVTLRFTYTDDVTYDPKDFTLKIAPLKSVNVNGYDFLYNELSKTAKITRYTIPGKKHLSIPSYLYLNDDSYEVKVIGDGAFEGYGLTSVDIPSVEYIGDRAFRSCPLLKVSLPWSLLGIGEQAFADNDQLKTVLSRTTHPFGIADNVFDYLSSTTLYVHTGKKSLYHTLSGWKKFENIKEEDDLENVVTYQIAINEENFPDANFRNYLHTENFFQPEAPGTDGVLTDLEIEKINSLELRGRNIQNMKGAELFNRVIRLECDDNNLTSLDLSAFESLDYLSCTGNKLTSLNLSGCRELTTIKCEDNLLTSLDVSGCVKLNYLNCSNNQLTLLNISGCTLIDDLNCQYNQLTSLDLSRNTVITSITCDNNRLTSLDVSKNTLLKYLYCNHNQLTLLDLSNLASLSSCNCFNNQLESLFIAGCKSLGDMHFYSNKLKGDVIDDLFDALPQAQTSNDPLGPPLPLYWLYVIDLSDENEGNVITPAQVAVATGKGWKVYDKSNAVYEGSNPTNYISITEDNFPDEEFRKYLMTQSYGTDGVVSDLELPTITTIALSGDVIDITGIELFSELESFSCYDGLLTSLDLSKNKKLKVLRCEKNILKTLDLSENTELEEVQCQNNKLITLVLPQSGKLKKVILDNNLVTSLDVSNNSLLTELVCSNNKLSSLNVTGCTAMEQLSCGGNKLNSIDLSDCINLSTLACENNQLSILDISRSTKLTYLSCSGNALRILDVSKNRRITNLYCNKNKLESLDLSYNVAIKRIRCYNNELTTLDVSNSPKLEAVDVYNNKINGVGMDAFIESLPEMNAGMSYYDLPIIDLTEGAPEGNVCTKDQVAALKAKGWMARYAYNHMFLPYEGSDPIKLGDVNGDGDVDIADAVCIVNYVVGKPNTSFNKVAADVNGDGDVDIADAVRIVNLVVGKISALSRPALRPAVEEIVPQ